MQKEDAFDKREVKVIQYGVGMMGSSMVRSVLKRKGLRLVGTIDILDDAIGEVEAGKIY